MPLPSAYTEPDLAKYMARVIGPSVAATLDWHGEGEITGDTDDNGQYSNLDAYEEPIYDTLFALEIDDIAELTTQTQIQALRAVARWQIWKHARESLADAYDESEGELNYRRSQMYEMAKENEIDAYNEAFRYLPGNTVTVQVVSATTVDESEAEFG